MKNKLISEINLNSLDGLDSYEITNSIIERIDFVACDIKIPVIIRNCIIGDLLIHSCWFKEGIVLDGNIVLSYVDYQMGGHNHKAMLISNNIFHDFVNFFDCQFMSDIMILNNMFVKGSNLLGNSDEGFKNCFGKNKFIEGNLGNIELDGVG